MFSWLVAKHELVGAETQELKRRWAMTEAELRTAQRTIESLRSKLSNQHIPLSPKSPERYCAAEKLITVVEGVTTECSRLDEFLHLARENNEKGEIRFKELVEDNIAQKEHVKMLQNECQAVSQRLTKVNADLRDTEQGKKDAEQGKASAEEAINALKYRESRLKEESAAMRAQCGMLKTQLEEERGKRRRLESDTISGVHPLHVGEEGVRESTLTVSKDAPSQPAEFTGVLATSGADRTPTVSASAQRVLLPKVPTKEGQCPACGEASYGLMVSCEGCRARFHSLCSRKTGTSVRGAADSFLCSECRLG